MRRFPQLVVALVALIAFVLGVCGYMSVVPVSGGAWGASSYSYADAAYRALQLFIMNRDDPPGAPLSLNIARFLAPLSALGGLSFFLERVQFRIRLYFATRRSHVVVCGLGRKGAVNVRALRAGKSVVAIERGDVDSSTTSTYVGGIPIVRGDAMDASVLESAGISTACEIIVACGNDDTDVRIVRQSVECIFRSDASSRTVLPVESRRVVRIVPHLDDAEPRVLLRRHFEKVNQTLRKTRLVLVDYCHQARAARSLFERFPLDRTAISADSESVPHLVLLGFGRMGEAILLQALQTAHFPNDAKLRVDIFDRRIEDRWRNFCGRYPNFASVSLPPPAEIRRHPGDLMDVGHFDRISEIVRNPEVQAMIVVALDDETTAARVVTHLPDVVSEQGVPVCVRIEQEGGLVEMMQDGGGDARGGSGSGGGVRVFGHIEATVDYDDERERMAQALHANYVSSLGGGAAFLSRPSIAPWEKLDEEFRESNRRAADFIPVILRSFGLRVVSVEEAARHGLTRVEALSVEQEDAAAVAEHGRWYAERFIAGWLPSDPNDRVTTSDRKNEARFARRSPVMVPWAQLSTEERSRARWPMKHVSETLAGLGKWIVRD